MTPPKATVHLLESPEAVRLIVERTPAMSWQERVLVWIMRVLACLVDADFTSTGEEKKCQ